MARLAGSMKGHHQLRVANARTEFHGRTPIRNAICARLAQDRSRPAGLTYVDDRLSLFAHVRKGVYRESCQDSALVFLREDVTGVGIFDGYGLTGTALSEGVPDRVISLLADGYPPNPKGLLLEAVSRLIQEVTFPQESGDYQFYGGSTGVLALLSDDGRFSAAAVSDSALYFLSKDGLRRLFDYHLVFVPGRELMPAKGMDVRAYMNLRNFVLDTIEPFGLNEGAVEEVNGHLGPGDALMLFTDGATKCLDIVADPVEGFVEDNSGAQDLSEIIGLKRMAQNIGLAVIEAVERRIWGESEQEFVVSGDRVRQPVDDDLGLVVLSIR